MASIAESADSAAPRYLVARVGGQWVAWELSVVREIIPARAVTRLPGAPPWVLGLLNLRGAVVTVMDLAVRLGLPGAEAQSVIVLELDERLLGVRVDAVESVALAEDARVEPVEAARAAEGLIAGMVRLENGTAFLVDAGALVRSVLSAA